jgi:hypothetical protein
MNKTLIPFFIIILFISACSKKNNVAPNNNNSSLLIGSWLVVSEHDRFYTTTTNTLVEDTTSNISEKKYEWTNIFNKNGTYYDVNYYDFPVLDTIAAHYSVSNQIINYTYDSNGFLEQYTILKISNTNLTLEETFEVVPTPGETQGLPPGTYKCISDTYYTKQ